MTEALSVHSIHQILPQFSGRDAIGTEALLIQSMLRKNGIGGEIFFHERGDSHIAKPFDHFNVTASGTACLYHFSVGSPIPFRLVELGHTIWTRYHNITPGYFFRKPLEIGARMACNLGRRQIPMVGLLSSAVLADSFYNLSEIAPHTSAKMDIVPVFRDYKALCQKGATASRFIASDSRKNILFVGRICPNKAQHDIIELIALDKMFGSGGCRLILVGGFYSDDFRDAIVAFAADLGLKISLGAHIDWSADVVIPGSLSDENMAACYRDADAFVCMSDHEGFGVPLVEAMNFKLPILAHRSSAVTETVGNAGLIVDKSNKIELLQGLKVILSDEHQRDECRRNGLIRGQELGLESASNKLMHFISRYSAAQIS